MRPIKYYFLEFWGFYNPNMLVQGKLTKLLYKKWVGVWNDFNFPYENRILDICKTYKTYLLKGKKCKIK